METENKFFTIIKNIPGGLTLVLPAYDLSTAPLTAEINWNERSRVVPAKYALSIGQDSALKRMYDEGMFSVEPAIDFKAAMQNIDPYFVINNPIKKEEVQKLIKDGNNEAIDDLLSQNNQYVTTLIAEVARTHDNPSASAIKHISKELKVDFNVEDETSEEDE